MTVQRSDVNSLCPPKLDAFGGENTFLQVDEQLMVLHQLEELVKVEQH
jgi:hypothetical protein